MDSDAGLLEQIAGGDIDHAQVALQEAGRVNLRYFCRELLGYRDMNAEHEALCEFLQEDPAPVRIILMPRYTFKSSLATVGDTLWHLVNHPEDSLLIYSDSTEKAEGFLLGIKAHILGQASRSLFRAVYGPWEVDPKQGVWNQGAIVVAPRRHVRIEPSVDTAGVETSKTGKHYVRIKFDDLVSDKNTTTRELMDKVEEVYKNADALLARSGRVDLIGTRWHYGDLYGRLLEQYRGREGFSVFLRKAQEGTRYVFQDIGKESLTEERVEHLRWKWGSYKFSCLMQNTPVDDETATFKVSDFRFYRPAERPAGLYITACLDPIPPHEGSRGDDAALTVVGTDSAWTLYVLDVVAGRLQPSEQLDALFALHRKWGIDAFGVETNAFQKVMVRDLEVRFREEALRASPCRRFHVEEFVGTSLPNKELRIRGLQPYHERGALRFPGTSLEALTGVWRDLAWQLIEFPKAKKDDLADSLAGHVRIHRAGTVQAVPREIPYSSAAWFEREHRKQELVVQRRLPRWRRRPLPALSFS